MKAELTPPEAAALAALASGCRFIALGPASSTAGLDRWLAPRAEALGAAVESAVDAASAAFLALGAAHAGARSLAVCAEGGEAASALRCAERVETPLVLLSLGEFAASALGNDLRGQLSRSCSRGEGLWGAATLSPVGARAAFEAAARAFALSERFQTAVVVTLGSGEAREVVEVDLDLPVDRGLWAVAPTSGEAFDRYLDEGTGVGPRAAPGQPGLGFTAAAGADGARSARLVAKRRVLDEELNRG